MVQPPQKLDPPISPVTSPHLPSVHPLSPSTAETIRHESLARQLPAHSSTHALLLRLLCRSPVSPPLVPASFSIQHVHLGVPQRPSQLQPPHSHPSILPPERSPTSSEHSVGPYAFIIPYPDRDSSTFGTIPSFTPLRSPPPISSSANLSQLSLSSPTIASNIDGTVPHTVAPGVHKPNNPPGMHLLLAHIGPCLSPPVPQKTATPRCRSTARPSAATTSRSPSCKSLIFANRWFTTCAAPPSRPSACRSCRRCK